MHLCLPCTITLHSYISILRTNTEMSEYFRLNIESTNRTKNILFRNKSKMTYYILVYWGLIILLFNYILDCSKELKFTAFFIAYIKNHKNVQEYIFFKTIQNQRFAIFQYGSIYMYYIFVLCLLFSSRGCLFKPNLFCK